MNLPNQLFLLILTSIILVITIHPYVYAQHHGGEQAPPIFFGDGEVTVTTALIPPDFIPDKNSSAHLKIRFFDTLTNSNIENVSYRVQIFSGTQLLANQMFFDKDGVLDIKIQPKEECQEKELWRCTKYNGDKDLIVPNALTSSPSSIPVITGPIFISSGEYIVKTDIIGAKNPKTQTSHDITFTTYLRIPSEQQFLVEALGSSYQIKSKSYAGNISKILYDDSLQSLEIKIPLDFEHIEHIDSLNHSFEIPKNFTPFSKVHSFLGKVNGQELLPKEIHYDKFSDKTNNIIHLTINNPKIKNPSTSDTELSILIYPNFNSTVVEKELQFENDYKALISFNPKIHAEDDFLFSITFFDQEGNLPIDFRYGYGIATPDGKEITNTGVNSNLLGINLPLGTGLETIKSLNVGPHSLQIGILGVGEMDFHKYYFEEFSFEISEFEKNDPIIYNESQKIPEIQIPPWIKNNAGWWADGSIGDSDFVQGIQFMIKNEIIIVSNLTVGSTEISETKIPPWIKNNAGWWADGSIGDSDFVQGIQFLVAEGIVQP